LSIIVRSNLLPDEDDSSLMDMFSFVNCPVGASSSGHSPGRCVETNYKIRF
jgi:hypothetical protein